MNLFRSVSNAYANKRRASFWELFNSNGEQSDELYVTNWINTRQEEMSFMKTI